MLSAQTDQNPALDSTTWPLALRRREALDQLNSQLAADPELLNLRFERACLLAQLGENERAKQEYLEVLARRPSHLGALNNLGTLLYSTGYRTAARTAYTEAVRRHPDQPMAHVNLGNLFLEAGDLDQARAHLEAAVALDSGFAPAHRAWGTCSPKSDRKKRLCGIRSWADGIVSRLSCRIAATPCLCRS